MSDASRSTAELIRELLRSRTDDEIVGMLAAECDARAKALFAESREAKGLESKQFADAVCRWDNRKRFWQTRRSRKPGGAKVSRFKQCGARVADGVKCCLEYGHSGGHL